MMNRRDFLKFTAYMTMAMKAGMWSPASASANPSATNPKGLRGMIVAAAYNPKREGPFASDTHETVLSRLNLDTGKIDLVPIEMIRAHDAMRLRGQNYLVMPNSGSNTMFVSDFGSAKEKIELPGNRGINGHGFFDRRENVIIVSVSNNDKKGRGEFAIIDPSNYKLMDMVKMKNYSPHDIQLLDEDTFAICNYNIKQSKNPKTQGFVSNLYDNKSNLSLYDRKTLKLKETIPAYDEAMISHATVTKDGDLFAVGFRDYYDDNVAKWENEYIVDKFASFYAEHHPELSAQWPDIVKNTPIHRVEEGVKNYGLPLLPMKMAQGSEKLEVVPFENFHHRRAQSICYVRESNTVAMAFPHTDSVLTYNATTGKSHTYTGSELSLNEMRGITEIEGTPYLAIAGIRRGITIVDTTTNKRLKYFDVRLGRVIHMHHIA